MFVFNCYARALKLNNDDNGWSRNEMTENDQSFLLRCPDVIGDLYIETLPSVSLHTYRRAGAAARTLEEKHGHSSESMSLSFKTSSSSIPLSPNPAHL